MNTLASNSPPLSIPIHLKPPAAVTTQLQNLVSNSYCARRIRLRPINSTSGSGKDAPQPGTPSDTVEIRFRRGSRRQRQQRDGSGRDKQPSKMLSSADNVTTPKKWEDMSLSEKATELYMGEKGLLFWLNKFAYASIFIIIGAWLLFRFVGPSLNLYQLDAPPLSPSNVFKGS